MSRIRLSLIAGGVAVAFVAASLSTSAQQGGRGNRAGGQAGRGGPGGQGGRGGPGGFGGFGGGPWGSILALAGIEPVQKEVKITEPQKTKISKLTTETEAKRRDFFQNIREQGDTAKAQLRAEQEEFANNIPQGNQPLDPRDQALTSGLQGAGQGFGANPYGGGQQQGVDPNVLQQQFRQQQSNVRRQGWAMMQQGMQQLQAGSEQSLAKILDRPQIRRLYEIQLQLDGPFAVLKPEIAERLEVRPEQAEEIRGIQNGVNQQRRQIMSQTRDIFRSLRDMQQAQAKAEGQDAADNGGANGNTGRGRQGAPGNNRAQAGNGGRGGQGGPGGNRRGFDREAMQKLMDQPEVKAKMEEIRKQGDSLTDKSYALVYKALDRRQVNMFRKMLGEPFDVSLVRQGFMRGGRGGPGAGDNAAPNGDESADDGEAEEPGATTEAPEETTAKSAVPKSESTTPKSSSGIQSTRRRGVR